MTEQTPSTETPETTWEWVTVERINALDDGPPITKRLIKWNTDAQRKSAIIDTLFAVLRRGGPFEINVGATTDSRRTFHATRNGHRVATARTTAATPPRDKNGK